MLGDIITPVKMNYSIIFNPKEMKIELDIISVDENPNDKEYFGYFYEEKEGMEHSLTKFAMIGILPNIGDEITTDGGVDYKVLSKTFLNDKILILVEWV